MKHGGVGWFAGWLFESVVSSEAYSAAGKTHLHQQVENQEEHAI